MKLILTVLCCCAFVSTVYCQGVAINDDNSSPNPNTILDISSAANDKGILIPRISTTDRTSMGDLDMAEDGLLVYDETTQSFWYWVGHKWSEIFAGATRLADLDLDTEVKVEATDDEDVIRFYLEGVQKMALIRNVNGEARLELLNNSSSVFIGEAAGSSNESTAQNNLGIGSYAMFANTSGIKNLALGANALSANTTGSFNIAIGEEALLLSDMASSNTAIGFGVLRANTTGANNLGIGPNALRSNTVGHNNIAVGPGAMQSNKLAWENIAIGSNTLTKMENGAWNVAIGFDALTNAPVSSGNTAVGYGALRNCTGGNSNSAFGLNALGANAEGIFNTAFGAYVMNGSEGDYCTAVGYNVLGKAKGDLHTAVGYKALFSDTTGHANTAIGDSALFQLPSGNYNTAIGRKSGYGGGARNNCTFLGASAWAPSNLTINNSTAIGANAKITTSNQIRVGNNSVTSIGGIVAWTNLSDGRFKTNIRENVPGLDFIKRLRPVTYQLDINKYNEFLGVPDSISTKSTVTKNLQTGFVAQEVQVTASKLGYEFSGVDVPANETSAFGLRYSEFVPPIVKAIQEQEATISKLTSENDELRDRLAKLEDLVAKFIRTE